MNNFNLLLFIMLAVFIDKVIVMQNDEYDHIKYFSSGMILNVRSHV